MSRILCLAPSGFGKTTSIGAIPELGIVGLDPKTTYLISVKGKPLPFVNAKDYVLTTKAELLKGNRVISNNPEEVAEIITILSSNNPNNTFKTIVLDDMNYLMQDWYMDNALKTGWDAPKKIGYFIGKLFTAIEKYQTIDRHIVVLAHGEAVQSQDGRTYVKLKTTGKMVDEYITPEGLFEITLVGKSRFDATLKRVVKEYITNEDEYFSSPKTPYGMFKELYIPNDLGYVINKINEYYK